MRLIAISVLCWLLTVGMAVAVAAADFRLVEAARDGHWGVARTLISEHVDVNVASQDGTTPLHWSVERDQPEVVTLLIEAGAKVNVINDFGMTPLALACRNGDVAIVDALLKAGADPNVALRTGETPIMTAAHAGSVEVVKRLIAAGADVMAKEWTAGQTALMWAAAEGHDDVVRTLIGSGADPHARSKTGFTALLFAARNGDIAVAQALLDSGVGVNEASPDGMTALVIAAERSQVSFAKFLLEHGADPNAGPGFTPLHWVVGDWSVSLAGDKTYVRPEGTEWDLVLPLQGEARLDFAKLLLDHGANVNALLKVTPRASTRPGGRGRSQLEGATPFWIAAQDANVTMMRFLLAAGANPHTRTSRNVSPLMAAAGVDAITTFGTTGVTEEDAVDAIKLCLELGEDVNTVSVAGEDALHGVAYRGNAPSNEIAQLLLNSGIDINFKNERGWSPLTIAEGIYTNMANTRNLDLVRFLQDHGAEPSAPNIERDAYAVITDDPAK